MKLDVRTPKEKEREKKHKEICSENLQIVRQLTELKASRIMLLLAIKFDMTGPGLRNILITYNLYTRKVRNHDSI